MCGLVGLFDRQGHAARHRDAVQRATNVLAHRGPDDSGYLDDGPIAFGFRRLSILDLTPAGHQPMTSHDGEWAVVFNGEIYNYRELRAELVSAGVVFRSDSDTEVLVQALCLWGPRSFDRFNGMWAVLAWHRPSQTLYACRDPWGIKPLYVSELGEATVFASEIKALRSIGCSTREVDPVAARRFLDEGELDVDTRTMFRDVKRLQPGTLYRYRAGEPVFESRYQEGALTANVPQYNHDEQSEQTFIELFREAFLSSVRLRLRADVEVGTCLSGGLDSTAIACATGRFLDEEGVPECRHAFTALLPEYDESAFIRPVVEQVGANWHVTVASDDHLMAEATRFFEIHDEPVHSLSPLAGFLVMGLAARSQVKVLLNGQGSDELLAGYDSSVLPHLRSLIREDGLGYAFSEGRAQADSAAIGVGLVARAQAGLLLNALPPSVETSLRRAWAALELGTGHYAMPGGPLGAPLAQQHRPSEDLQVALLDQVYRSPLPLYLRIEDANSSAFSLEARLPFLDPNLVAVAHAAPARLLRRNGLNKYMLRQILPGLVPEVVWQRRDKMGFPVPVGRWLRGPLRELFTETLSEARLRRRGWYSVSRVTRDVDRFLQDRTPGSPPPPALMRLFLLERWARSHLDQ
ncbi:MAG: asparagine synthase (glutamine-hydrolyzing) [Myxococcota bacterium]